MLSSYTSLFLNSEHGSDGLLRKLSKKNIINRPAGHF